MSTAQNEIARVQPGEIQTAPQAPDTSPAALLAMAVQQGASLEQVRELMALKREWEADEARKAFHTAVAAFKRNPPQVIKDMRNVQYDSWYSSLANLVNSVIPALGEHGLSTHWDIDQQDNGMVTVTCVMTHVLGHSERVTLSGPPDESGKKNRLQQIKSTITYLKVATFEAITGIATAARPDRDDDGNGSGKGPEVITEEQAADLEALIDELGAKLNRANFLKFLKVDRLENLPANKYQRAKQALEDKRREA